MRWTNAHGILTIILALIAASPAASAGGMDGVWVGVLRCTGKTKPFVSERRARLSGGRVYYLQGEEGEDGFEVWQGVIDDQSQVMIYGRYTWQTTKYLWFKGEIRDGALRASGQRGPRRCRLRLSKINKTF